MKKLVIKNMKTQKNIKKPQWQWNPSLLCCHGKKCILKTRYWERSLSKATTDIIFPSTVAQLKQSFIVCVCVCVMKGCMCDINTQSGSFEFTHKGRLPVCQSLSVSATSLASTYFTMAEAVCWNVDITNPMSCHLSSPLFPCSFSFAHFNE